MLVRTVALTALSFQFVTGCGGGLAGVPTPRDTSASAVSAANVPTLDERTPAEDADPCMAARAGVWSAVDGIAEVDVERVHEDQPGSHTVRVDASAGGMQAAATSPHVFLSLLQSDSPLPISDIQAGTSDEWHIALKRTVLRINSGDSGPGDVRLARVAGAWEDVVTAPEAALQSGGLFWATDRSVDEQCEIIRDPIGQPWSAIHTLNQDNPSGSHSWYLYGPDGVSVPSDVLYVVHDQARAAAWLLQIVGWQDGVWTLRWQPISVSLVAGVDAP